MSSLDSWDLYQIEKKISDAQRKTADDMRTLRTEVSEGAKTQKQMLEAFNRMAKAIENLSTEVKALRADLNPSLDKPKKLPAPATPAGG